MNDVVTPKSRGHKAPPKKEGLAQFAACAERSAALGHGDPRGVGRWLYTHGGGHAPGHLAAALLSTGGRRSGRSGVCLSAQAVRQAAVTRHASGRAREAAPPGAAPVRRQQALVRATQRSAGVSLPVKPTPTKPPAKPDRTGRKRRRPTVRALKAVAILQNQLAGEVAAAIQPDVSPSSSAMAPTADVEV